ncbi:hypothetical protein P8935_16880 [Telmatobacter sp. DSM 110680]|uniref:Uncharacterized protein n=1 Tax=Telmatobacter sp. DSM 110680 TaxID=3036704 RepID=A0AAU7DFX6_9BACT
MALNIALYLVAGYVVATAHRVSLCHGGRPDEGRDMKVAIDLPYERTG